MVVPAGTAGVPRTLNVAPAEVADGSPVRIGRIPLEMMGWVVGVKGRKPIGNPAHGGGHVPEVL